MPMIDKKLCQGVDCAFWQNISKKLQASPMTTHQYRFFNECGIDGWLVVEGVSSDSPVAVSMSSKYVFGC